MHLHTPLCGVACRGMLVFTCIFFDGERVSVLNVSVTDQNSSVG